MPSKLVITYHPNVFKQQDWLPDWTFSSESNSETVSYEVFSPTAPENRLRLTLCEKQHETTQPLVFLNASGPVLVLNTPEHCHFVLPGGRLSQNGVEAHFEGQLPQAGSPKQATHTPQTVTKQAMILAAGFATRLEPVAGEITGHPKPALPLGNGESVISTMAKHLASFGIERLIVNTSFLPQAVKDSLATLEVGEHPVEIFYIDEESPSGTAGGLLSAFERDLIAKDEPILVVQGDAVSNFDIGELLTVHETNQARVTIGVQTVCDDDVHKFGIVETGACAISGSSMEILSFKEKPSLEAAGDCRCANTGFYVLSPVVYDLFMSLGRQCRSRGLYDFANDFFPAVLSLSREETGSTGKMLAHSLEGYWADIGNAMQYYQTLCELGHRHLASENGVLTLPKKSKAD